MLLTLSVSIQNMHGSAFRDFRGGFSHIQGDNGDARLNNLFLEHNYDFWSGQAESYWHAPWQFFPSPYSFALSDNLAASAPIYVAMRFLGIDGWNSFQWWLIACTLLNYVCCVLMLRVMGFSGFPAHAGGLLFAFGLPRLAQITHAQLYPHFGAPLLIAAVFRYFTAAMNRARGWYLIGASACLVWQLWAGVYLGFFTYLGVLLLLIVSMMVRWRQIGEFARRLRTDWVWWLASAVMIAIGSAALLWPYYQAFAIGESMQVRSWDEVAPFVPRSWSYLIPGHTRWYHLFNVFAPRSGVTVGVLHEHPLFVGLVAGTALVFTFFAVVTGSRFVPIPARVRVIAIIALGVLTGYFLLTLHFSGVGSLWRILYEHVPGFGGIRVVSRVIIAMLLPLAVIMAVTVTIISEVTRVRWPSAIRFMPVIFCILLVIDQLAAGTPTTDRVFHERQLASITEKLMAKGIAQKVPCTSFYLRQLNQPYFLTNVGAIWVSHNTGIPTINGYAGGFPPGWRLANQSPEIEDGELLAWREKHAGIFASDGEKFAPCIIE